MSLPWLWVPVSITVSVCWGRFRLGQKLSLLLLGWRWRPRAPGRCDLLGFLAEEDRKLANSYETVHVKGTYAWWLITKRDTWFVSWNDLWHFLFYKQNILTKRICASLFQFSCPYVYKSGTLMPLPSSGFTFERFFGLLFLQAALLPAVGHPLHDLLHKEFNWNPNPDARPGSRPYISALFMYI
jgi:hypothetical protein